MAWWYAVWFTLVLLKVTGDLDWPVAAVALPGMLYLLDLVFRQVSSIPRHKIRRITRQTGTYSVSPSPAPDEDDEWGR